MRVEQRAFDHTKPDGEQFTLTWYPETDAEYMCAADRCRPGDRIETDHRVFFALSESV